MSFIKPHESSDEDLNKLTDTGWHQDLDIDKETYDMLLMEILVSHTTFHEMLSIPGVYSLISSYYFEDILDLYEIYKQEGNL